MKYIQLLLFNTIIFINLMYAHDGDHDAKNRHGKGKPSGCAIYGTVLDSITSKPIEYASISVIRADKTIVTGGITNFEGKNYVGSSQLPT